MAVSSVGEIRLPQKTWKPWSQPQHPARPDAEIRHPPLIHERQIRVATVCLTEGSSYLTVLLNTMPASDSLPLIPPLHSLNFILHNQALTLAVSAALLWHVSCVE